MPRRKKKGWIARWKKSLVTRIEKAPFLFIRKILWKSRRFRFTQTIQHLYGPQKIKREKYDLCAFCVVRNGEKHIDHFIQHHIQIGVRHFFFLDNGSTDRTIEFAKKYINVTIFQTHCSFKKNKIRMKRWLIQQGGIHQWALLLDIDERYTLPSYPNKNLEPILKYLSQQGFQSVPAHQLDLFSQKSVIHQDQHLLWEDYRYFDQQSITYYPYPEGMNKLCHSKIQMAFGGIRSKAFDLKKVLLTKHPLFFVEKGEYRAIHGAHFPRGAKIADFNGILLHYQFIPDFHKNAQAIKRRKSHHRNSRNYKKILNKLKVSPTLSLFDSDSEELKDLIQLQNTPLVQNSENYLKYIKSIPIQSNDDESLKDSQRPF